MRWHCLRAVDIRRHGARNGKHIWVDVDADNMSGGIEPFLCNARNYSCAAGDVEDTMVWSQLYLFEGRKRGPTSQRSYISGKLA